MCLVVHGVFRLPLLMKPLVFISCRTNSTKNLCGSLILFGLPSANTAENWLRDGIFQLFEDFFSALILDSSSLSCRSF